MKIKVNLLLKVEGLMDLKLRLRENAMSTSVYVQFQANMKSRFTSNACADGLKSASIFGCCPKEVELRASLKDIVDSITFGFEFLYLFRMMDGTT
ncbi:hypothetical protein R1flu_009909 [Riccia fluitans]|uniref:Uncharacterized protein n=1 Tax=Riccia fluitans TaxID=41844 RepID=A0ABD1Z6H3_9MARC